jgi:hypothetical protein
MRRAKPQRQRQKKVQMTERRLQIEEESIQAQKVTHKLTMLAENPMFGENSINDKMVK